MHTVLPSMCNAIVHRLFWNYHGWILLLCIVDFAVLYCGFCNRAAEAASEMQQKIPALKHSWSHDDAGAVERWGGAEADMENIYTVCSSSSSEDIFKHSVTQCNDAGAERWSMGSTELVMMVKVMAIRRRVMVSCDL